MGRFRVILFGFFLAVLLSGCGEAAITPPTQQEASIATPAPTKRTSISREELNYPCQSYYGCRARNPPYTNGGKVIKTLAVETYTGFKTG